MSSNVKRDHHLWTRDTIKNVSGDVTLDIDDSIILDTGDGDVIIKDSGFDFMTIKSESVGDASVFKLLESPGGTDYMSIKTTTHGATTIETRDFAAAAAHLTLDPDGDLLISGADVKIDAAKKLYLDGGGDTYILESGADNLAIVVGGFQFVNATEGLNGQMDWKFRDAAVGFDINTATFHATDTFINFRAGNKCKLTLTADITDVHFTFPNMSGNFVCLFIQDGTGGWDVTNWKTRDSSGIAGSGNSGVVLWSGGTAPSLTETANKTDIISLFWDASTETAYAVASENF